jgi:hypothetical protein
MRAAAADWMRALMRRTAAGVEGGVEGKARSRGLGLGHLSFNERKESSSLSLAKPQERPENPRSEALARSVCAQRSSALPARIWAAVIIAFPSLVSMSWLMTHAAATRKN